VAQDAVLCYIRPVGKARRVVEMTRPPTRGGHPRTWGYGYPELAALFGMTEGAVRQAVLRRSFVPGDLGSVLAFAVKRRRA
jgi:hypothetical protein